LRGTDDGGTTGINSLGSFSVAQVTPILTYHVAPNRIFASQVPATAAKVGTLGGTVSAVRGANGVTIDSATVTTANIFASNGVVHVINQSVLLPSIADVVTTEPSLSSLAGLVGAATGTPSVAGALDGTTNFTLFAPNNAAVAAVPSASVPTGQNLTNLLLLHAGTQVSSMVTSPIYASTVLGLSAPVTLNTALSTRSLTVGPLTGTVRVAPIPTAGAAPTLTTASPKVRSANLFTSNGVIHVIDQVLIP
jgi:uncharacterized surface protein with fasciclin (FAS1) repeats